MKTFFFLASLLILSACGRSEIDPRLAPYLERFQEIGSQYGRQVSAGALSLKLGDVLESQGERGHCETGFLKSPTITIDREFWGDTDELGREVLVFHELGHCLLGRDHKDSGSLAHPDSLMHSGGLGGTVYDENRDYYRHELFTAN